MMEVNIYKRLAAVTRKAVTPVITVTSNTMTGVSVCSLALCMTSLLTLTAHAQNSATDEFGYRVKPVNESEFDNRSESFVKSWREAEADYEDTEFGELVYNEASTPTKLELLRLLSKETPSMTVFMHALAMGIDIESVLKASIEFQPSRSRDLASSATNLLPLLPQKTSFLYSGYELEDLERDDESRPYSVQRVVEKFFEDRLVLRPYPDWFDGQYHFLASAAELKALQEPQKDIRWYRSKSTQNTTKRPIFVSLYESTRSVLIDGEERIAEALKQDPNALLPVVFIFNRMNERAIDELGYPPTIKGVQSAYVDKGLMLTPVPEWQLGEYNLYSGVEDFYDLFNIPVEEDFEPEHWQRLLAEAEDYSVTNTAFLFVVVGSSDDEKVSLAITEDQLYAAWDDPRTETAYPYVSPGGSRANSLSDIVGDGVIFNRPDLIAALNALGVEQVPVTFYYIDDTRVKPYFKGPRGLIQAAVGAGAPPAAFGGGGFGPDAPPPPPPGVPVPPPPPPVAPPPPPPPPAAPPPAAPPPASPPGLSAP